MLDFERILNTGMNPKDSLVLTRFLVSAMLIVLGVRDDQARRFSKCVKR